MTWVLIISFVMANTGFMGKAGPYIDEHRCIEAYHKFQEEHPEWQWTEIQAHCRDDATGRSIQLRRD